MLKRNCLAALVCLNLILLTGLVLGNYSLPAAEAQQVAGLAENYMLVAGEIQDQYDALYVIDVRERTIHAFMFDRGRKSLQYSDARELDRDFRNKEGG